MVVRITVSLLALALSMPASAKEPSRIKSVELRDGAERLTLVVQGSRPPDVTSFVAKDPYRLVIDWSGSRGARQIEPQSFAQGVVRAISTEQFESESEQISRITISLSEPAPYYVRSDGNRVLVQIVKPTTGPQPLRAPVVSRSPSVAPPVKKVVSALAPPPKTDGSGPLQEPVVGIPPMPKTPKARVPKLATGPLKVAAVRSMPRIAPKTGPRAAPKDAPVVSPARAVPVTSQTERVPVAVAAGGVPPKPSSSARAVHPKVVSGAPPAQTPERERGAAPVAVSSGGEEAEPVGLEPTVEAEHVAKPSVAPKADVSETPTAIPQAARAQTSGRRPAPPAPVPSEPDAAAMERESPAPKPAAEAPPPAPEPAPRDIPEEELLASFSAPVPTPKPEPVLLAQAEASEVEDDDLETDYDQDEAGAPAPDERPRQMTYIGFRQMPSGSRVFMRVDGKAKFSARKQGKRVIVVLKNTRVPLRNNRRPLDTSFFDSAVAMIQAFERGTDTEIEIRLRNAADFKVKEIANTIAVDFGR